MPGGKTLWLPIETALRGVDSPWRRSSELATAFNCIFQEFREIWGSNVSEDLRGKRTSDNRTGCLTFG
jgi:hypothetical protein